MRDFVGFRFCCSNFARSHSMTDAEGGKRSLIGAGELQPRTAMAAIQFHSAERDKVSSLKGAPVQVTTLPDGLQYSGLSRRRSAMTRLRIAAARRTSSGLV